MSNPPPRAAVIPFCFGAFALTHILASTSAQVPPATFASDPLTRGPEPRSNGELAYDPARKRTVLYGGRGATSGLLSSETWEWDGVGWIRQLPTVSPGLRENHALAYAPGLGIVLFGGNAGSATALDDMWYWDGLDWRQLVLGTMPPARRGASMVWHGGTSPGLLLFGGLDAAGLPTNQTWRFDGQSWSLQSTTGPGPRSQAGMAYADSRQRTYLLGGIGGGSELWTWDGSSWSAAVPFVLIHTVPWLVGTITYVVPTDYPSLAWDAARDQLVAVHGTSLNPLLFHATPDPASPTHVSWAQGWHPFNAGLGLGGGMADLVSYDHDRQRTVFVGGGGYSVRRLAERPANTGNWVHRGGVGSTLFPLPRPSARSYGKMAYRSASGQTLLFGGSNGSGALGDTWSFDGESWTDHGTSQLAPARSGHALCAFGGNVILFGGGVLGSGSTGNTYFNDTRQWSGTDWSTVAVTGSSPSPRMNHDLVYDGARGRAVMFGGYNGTELDETWSLTAFGANHTWKKHKVSGQPPARHSHRLASDDQRQRIVMFGGCGAAGQMLGDTWELSGSTWFPRTPPQSPCARWNHSMHYDAQRGIVVLIGGYTHGLFLDDVWEYDGVTWVQVSPATALPPGREGTASTYNMDLRRLVMAGGYNWTNGMLGDVWFYNCH